MAFSSYASIASASEPVKSWDAAVEEVKARRVASDSEAEFAPLALTNASLSPVLRSSAGTVSNTVDRTGISVLFYNADRSKTARSYISSDGYIQHVTTDFDIKTVDFILNSTCLPNTGNYSFSFDISSDFSYDLTSLRFWTYQTYKNAERDVVNQTISNYEFVSGDIYLPPTVVAISKSGVFTISLAIKSSGLRNFGGAAKFRFVRTEDTPSFSAAGSGTDMSNEIYQEGVTSGLSNIGDTLEEIVETISLQIEALWNQMYNFMHLPQYAKLEEIRQAIENIRLDVDVDNHDVVNKLDEQIANDNANTSKVEKAVEKHGNFIIEGLKSLFIPDDEYFSSLFDRLHQFFSDRLGFLYVPFDLLIRLLDAIKNADTAFAGIPFPGIQAGEWVLLEPTTVTFDILNEFPELVSALHFITSVVMIGAFLNLLHRKMEEVMSR